MKLRFQLRDGTPYSLDMQGTPDLVDLENMAIYDYKLLGDFVYYDSETKQRVTRSLPTPEHELQINLYGLMYRWQGDDIQNLYIWYAKSEGKKGGTQNWSMCRSGTWRMPTTQPANSQSQSRGPNTPKHCPPTVSIRTIGGVGTVQSKKRARGWPLRGSDVCWYSIRCWTPSATGEPARTSCCYSSYDSGTTPRPI